MKLCLIAMCLALAVAVSAPAFGDERLYARFRIDVHEGSNLTNTAVAAGYMTAGEPMEHDAGEYKVSLAVRIGDSDEYVLRVELVSMESPERFIVEGEFDARLVGGAEGPLEFSTERDGIRVSGVLALSRVD